MEEALVVDWEEVVLVRFFGGGGVSVVECLVALRVVTMV